MKSNAEKISKVAKAFLRKKELQYTKIGVPQFIVNNDNLDEFHNGNYWVVNYEYMVFQEEDAFVHIDDTSETVLFILTKHGRIYDEEPIIGDDGEDWDDI